MGNQEKNGKSREKWEIKRKMGIKKKWEIKRKTEIKKKMFFLTEWLLGTPFKDSLNCHIRPESIQYCFSGIIFKKLKKAVSKKN
ncbi:hypothetical protein [Methanosarcina vacuolata]|uniref:Uncharacterized protein n=1 Tax=Methanosarcina vacuolata Z-761 TaxID=1434123 RepID=A0A0E3Q3J8_9EURY|nr:hypothetical protein [Methanosarcina vacuolata]AKB43200.1 hypothetical protein MSVAZ_0931 [Methanosarcina vacuolata Z-761]